MYEKPNLTRVGDAQEVILGTTDYGHDLDMTFVSGLDEFAFDDFENA